MKSDEQLHQAFVDECHDQYQDGTYTCAVFVVSTHTLQDIGCDLEDKCPMAEEIQEWREKNVMPDPEGDHT